MSSGKNGELLPHADLREVRRRLAELPARQKLDFLLEAPDPLRLVQALPEQEIYQAVLEIGPADAAELISLSSPAQFLHFVDRSAWPRADLGPSSAEVLRWLTLARESAGTSDQAVRRYREKLARLDAELLELILREQLRIHDLEEGKDHDIADWSRTWRTPEGKYLIEFVADGAEYGTLKQLLEDLFARDQFEGARLLESIRWEMPAELAELARRWRDGRLRDQGFPSIDEALSFYARPAKRSASESTQGTTSSTALAAPEQPLLERALPLVPADSWERVEEGLLYASNAALVASGAAPDDPFAARAVLQDARSTLSLGLEVLSAGEAEKAASLLVERPIREIFQAGVGELYALSARARKVAQSAQLPGAKTATLLEAPYSELLELLGRKRPALPDPRAKGRGRAPSSRAEVARAEAQLDEAAAIPQLLEVLGVGPQALGPLTEAAGLTPSAVRASDALRAKARAELLGLATVSFSDPEVGPPSQAEIGLSSEQIDQKIDELLGAAAKLVGTPAASRAAEVLRRSRR